MSNVFIGHFQNELMQAAALKNKGYKESYWNKSAKGTNSYLSPQAWAAKYRAFLKVVDLWVKSLPLVIEYNITRLPKERIRNHFPTVDSSPKFNHLCFIEVFFYSKHIRQLQLSFKNLAQFVVGSHCVTLWHTCLSVAGKLFWLLSFLFLLFSCHTKRVNATISQSWPHSP